MPGGKRESVVERKKIDEEEIYLQRGITVSPRVIFRASSNE